MTIQQDIDQMRERRVRAVNHYRTSRRHPATYIGAAALAAALLSAAACAYLALTIP